MRVLQLIEQAKKWRASNAGAEYCCVRVPL